MTNNLENFISDYVDFPKQGILFRDISPLLQNPQTFSDVIESMSRSKLYDDADAIIAIDSRGFIFGSAISMKLSKPMVIARKPGKLPGELLEKSYELEYGSNSLCIQKKSIENYKNFVIVDDLIATGGTARCLAEILAEDGKNITGLSVCIELGQLNARANLPFPVDSQITF
ncbi:MULTISPECIES: adenine phosphoribosyltransferase [unclassified Prochlorococcus]|uniref:adenine phosphoribosyltransferase n=1 Tax=unclassified Prochlorococcus TaxID=2627481 RepID=UPI000533AC0A|nr:MULTISPECIES: adenine phosphoribosyltransferase [unclassified Prochlorococcus]KGG15585.1 Adenine phosphoribosyltransferase [Prochlorococcus sp. MIT 0602]KGG17865.1 Adenine phosphoribosyltransferase [Prochlorococcus sp. MIT 0603]